MGDHRASVKLEMDFHGKNYKQEMWINYSPDDSDCDQRIIDWFGECYRDGMARYETQQFEASREIRERSERERELAELARLKSKYES